MAFISEVVSLNILGGLCLLLGIYFIYHTLTKPIERPRKVLAWFLIVLIFLVAFSTLYISFYYV
ncbi:hypothetical protein BAZO_18898 [Schinkia azotoformans LMG 9581]|uniref:Uncharacterized protein n=1 Tax=Schinkia azotoformans LMG 9581 TaxID=1131731 RepID=K6D485_SCHAZ|nr:hypothetical protein BAZO_18898 [Schinkia azotoformans LMG 9581]